MTTDLDTVLSQKRELDILADSLREARSKLIRHKSTLDESWAAAEIGMIDDAIERINRRLNRTADELNDIGTDVLKVYRELEEQERIERERAEAEARAKREAEAAAARREAAEKAETASKAQSNASKAPEQSAGAKANEQAAQMKDAVSEVLNSVTGALSGLFRK